MGFFKKGQVITRENATFGVNSEPYLTSSCSIFQIHYIMKQFPFRISRIGKWWKFWIMNKILDIEIILAALLNITTVKNHRQHISQVLYMAHTVRDSGGEIWTGKTGLFRVMNETQVFAGFHLILIIFPSLHRQLNAWLVHSIAWFIITMFLFYWNNAVKLFL